MSNGGSSDELSSNRRSLKRKSAVADATPRRKSPPVSPCKQPAVALHQSPAVERGVPLPPPEARAVPEQEDANIGEDGSDDEASVAELGVRLFPPKHASAMWVRFVEHVKACLKHYNRSQEVLGDGFVCVEEPDRSFYLHMNFTAQDENGRSQLFFGEIKECYETPATPKEEDVTCCCPVFPSDAGGKGIRSIEEAPGYVFPDGNAMDKDPKNCYACGSRVKHPKGTCYVAGHIADTRQYFQL